MCSLNLLLEFYGLFVYKLLAIHRRRGVVMPSHVMSKDSLLVHFLSEGIQICFGPHAFLLQLFLFFLYFSILFLIQFLQDDHLLGCRRFAWNDAMRHCFLLPLGTLHVFFVMGDRIGCCENGVVESGHLAAPRQALSSVTRTSCGRERNFRKHI